MFHMEQSSRPPSLKLPLMDDITKLLQNQDTVIKPSTSSTTSLDIGQFVPNPPNRGNWYPVAGENFEQKPEVVPQSFSNIARPGYKGLPSASINQRKLVKLEYMVRECIATSNFLSTLSTIYPEQPESCKGPEGKDIWLSGVRTRPKNQRPASPTIAEYHNRGYITNAIYAGIYAEAQQLRTSTYWKSPYTY